MHYKYKKTKILICEDDLYSSNYLRELLIEISEKHEIQIANNLLNSIKKINEFNPDLIFLDINLGHNNSFEIFEVFDFSNLNIIFVTSYDNFAYNAFKIDAIDYILKPFSLDNIKNSIHKYLNKSNNHNLLDDKILIWIKNKYELIEMSKIIKIKSSNQYTYLHLENGDKIIQSNSLNEFELKLNNSNFLRIHDSCIINMKFVKSYIPGINARVLLTNEDLEKISRRKKMLFLKYFKLD
jgi:two-component system LytT family response regulator